MPDRFSVCLAETLRWEGGWSNDPYDPGGATMKGVIQKEYNAYRRSKGLPQQSVRQISDDEIKDIYRNSYWTPVRGSELFPGLDLEVWDFGVNSGPVTAVRKLQQVLGIAPDGHIGTQTLAAINQVNDRESLIEEYIEARRAYLRSLRTFWRFGQGWLSRCDGIEHAATAACHGDNVHPITAAFADIPQPHPDPDVQSASQGRAPAEIPAPPAATETTLALGGSGGLATAMPNILARATASGKATASGLIWAVLSEPLFWVAAVALFGAVTTYLWRRKHRA